MTLIWDINNSPVTGAQSMFKMKTLLVAAGWTIKSSGDGVSAFGSSSDVIANGGSGSNGLANTNAWFRIQSPSGTGSREFLIQRNATNVSWSIRYSFSAGFTGGSPSATVLPTATDSQTLVNTTIFDTDLIYRFNAFASNSVTDGYRFCLFTFKSGGNASNNPSPLNGAWMYDPLKAGSFSPLDQDPVMHYVSTGGLAFSSGTTTDNLGYLKKGLGGEGFVNIPWGKYRIPNNTIFPTGTGTNVYNGKNMLMPVIYARSPAKTAPVGYKGMSSTIQWCGNRLVSPVLISVNSSKDFIIIGEVALPWNGSDILI